MRNKSVAEILHKVLEKVRPSREELRAEKEVAEKVMKHIRQLKGKHIETMMVGSTARNTHLKGDRDIDIFVLYPKELSREEFEKDGLRIGKEVFKGHEWRQEFAEHPYIRGNIEGFEIEIVPSYKVDRASELLSAVDRSPFHMKYLSGKMAERQKDEARLLRAFLKGIDCYGAKLSVNSVPGYVVELLILKYGNFLKCLEAVSDWKKETIIDLEGHWKEKEEECGKKFQHHHLIVVDPTDGNRNVAAALSFNQFARFIAAARRFLEKPDERFFFRKKEKPFSAANLREKLADRRLIVAEMPYPKNTHPEIITGQLKKLKNKLKIQLALNEFGVIDLKEWANEKNLIAFVIEPKDLELEKIRKHTGPEVTDRKASENFLNAHKGIEGGPRIENGKWVVEKKRKHWNAAEFVKWYFRDELKREKEPLKGAMGKAKIYRKEEALNLYRKDESFREFFTKFLKGKEEFLEY